ncbi:hypothetical protein G6F45_014053 [Rhizopus arrhizus]|nr:hypothetical protein G6F45_014053 [Rhizopus arrhizus]
MCGGANVIGTFVAAVKAKLPLNLVVVVPAVENAIDGNAYRPSDVITSMSGKTIERAEARPGAGLRHPHRCRTHRAGPGPAGTVQQR